MIHFLLGMAAFALGAVIGLVIIWLRRKEEPPPVQTFSYLGRVRPEDISRGNLEPITVTFPNQQTVTYTAGTH